MIEKTACLLALLLPLAGCKSNGSPWLPTGNGPTPAPTPGPGDSGKPVPASLDKGIPPSFDPAFNELELDTRTGLPSYANEATEVPVRVTSLTELLSIRPGWKYVALDKVDKAGLGLVLSTHGCQMRLKHVAAELDGSKIYGRVQNEVAAEIGDRDVDARERRAIEKRVVASLSEEDRKDFEALIDAQNQALLAHVAVIAGDGVFWSKAVESVETFGDLWDGGSPMEKLAVLERLGIAVNQTDNLQRLRGHCVAHGELLKDRLAQWDSITEEL